MWLLRPAFGFTIKDSYNIIWKNISKVIPQDTENQTGYLDLQSFSN